MKNIGSCHRCAPCRVLLTGSDPNPPAGFQRVKGLLMWRPHLDRLLVWDGQRFAPLNQAGWYSRYDQAFPTAIPVDSWAIVAPLKLARAASGVTGMDLTRQILQWAFRAILPAPATQNL